MGVSSFAQSGKVVELQKDINALLNQKYLENSVWGISIQSIQNGENLFSLNTKRNFIPASNRKILTSIFDLVKLGPDFQYRTYAYLQGIQKDSVFFGNLIVRGMGDPTLSGRFNENRPTEVFEAWADSLKKRGIKIIRGRIVGDDNFFGDDVLGSFWEWDGESNWYSAQLSGLSFNDNCVDWTVIPSKTKDTVAIKLSPNTKYLHINNRLHSVVSQAAANGAQITRRRATNIVDATGNVFREVGAQSGNVTMENPTLFTVTVLNEVLQSRGIQSDSGVADIDSLYGFSYSNKDSNLVILGTYKSPKLAEMLKIINKKSQNFYAEQIWRTVAALDSNGTGEHAIEMEKKFLQEIGLRPDKMSLCDGSGYARGNLVSPNDIVLILKWIRQHKYWTVFKESLPVAGEDGTLKNRMKEGHAFQNAIAKTGYLDNVKSISGYVRTIDKEPVVFSIICNNFTADRYEVEKVQDQIIELIAGFSRE